MHSWSSFMGLMFNCVNLSSSEFVIIELPHDLLQKKINNETFFTSVDLALIKINTAACSSCAGDNIRDLHTMHSSSVRWQIGRHGRLHIRHLSITKQQPCPTPLPTSSLIMQLPQFLFRQTYSESTAAVLGSPAGKEYGRGTCASPCWLTAPF